MLVTRGKVLAAYPNVLSLHAHSHSDICRFFIIETPISDNTQLFCVYVTICWRKPVRIIITIESMLNVKDTSLCCHFIS